MHEHDYFLPIFAQPNAALDWLIPGLLPTGYLTLLAAPPKSGKTSFATALALAVATGTPFGNLETNQSAVLWVAAEECPEERNQLLSLSEHADPCTPLYTCYNPIAVESEESLNIIQHAVIDTQAKLLIIDPLHGATEGRSLADGWSARKTLAPLKRFCGATGITALVLHHSSNSYRRGQGEVAESAQLAATASMTWVLQNTTPLGSAERNLLLTCRGRGEFANRHWHIQSNGPLEYTFQQDPLEVVAKPIRTDYTSRYILEFLIQGPATSTQIIESCNLAPSTLRNCLTNLKRQGTISVTESKDGNLYSLSERLESHVPIE